MQKADNAIPAQPALQTGRLAYPINDFAEALGIGRSKVYEEIRDGRLQAKKLGSRTLITAQAASEYLSQLPDIDAAKAA
jgi:excisionase family DNA binding protein